MFKKFSIGFLALAVIVYSGVWVYRWVKGTRPAPPPVVPARTGQLPPAATGTIGDRSSTSSRQVFAAAFIRNNNLPDSEKLVIGTLDGSVEINNPYRAMISADEGIVGLRQAPDYGIIYQPEDSSFQIQIGRTQDFEGARKTAEKDLLNILGVAPVEACKLTISIIDYYNPGTPVLKPTFCLAIR